MQCLSYEYRDQLKAEQDVSRGEASYLYSERDHFKFWWRRRYSEVFSDFPPSLQKIPAEYLKLNEGRFMYYPFQLSIHYLQSFDAIYSLSYW
jgi:hypothetical protein